MKLFKKIVAGVALAGCLYLATIGILLWGLGFYIWQDERLLNSLPTTRTAVEKHLFYTSARPFEPWDEGVWNLKEGETGVKYKFLWGESIDVVYTSNGWVSAASYWD